MLPTLRVIDLTDGGAALAGRIFADLGADVILVEPPGGKPSRRLGPFVDETPDPEKSLEFWSSHRGKRSVVLDLEREADRSRLRSLVATADVWIDDAPIGHFAGLGLGDEALRAIQPRLVHASITPFGELGPKSGWAATDLTVSASSATLVMQGDADRAPLGCTVPQAFFHGGAEAASGILLALRERERSGLGQHIDVSTQVAMMQACQSNVLAHGWHDRPLSRSGGGVGVGRFRLRFIYECIDGYVNLTLLFGEPIGHATARFFAWMHEEGFASDALRDEDWVRYGAKVLDPDPTPEAVEAHEEVMRAIERFTRTKTKAELFAAAFERKLLVVPLSDCRDLLQSKQLAERAFWTPVKDPVLDRELLVPGPFARFSETPLRIEARPPRLGEHTAEILEALPQQAAATDDAAALAVMTQHADAEPAERSLPLAGLKVLDFSWVYAGPAITRQLADYGATVIKVECGSAHDALHGNGPFMEGRPGAYRSANFANVNLGKQSLGLNMKRPGARDIALRLVDWADVVVENFSPRAMKAWSLDWPHLRERKPSVVMLSSSLSGATGPESTLAGYGTMGSALAGFGFLTGWPDRRPCAPYMAYTDYVSPRFAIQAILAALAHRDRTGRGQHIDLSQAECTIQLLGSAILEHAANGRIPIARGNHNPHYAPSGVYPVSGEDRFIAIAAPDEACWAALCGVAGTDWARDPRFASHASRCQNRESLDAAISEWSAALEVEALESRLQAAGVPAHRVTTSRDAFEDPQLAARGHFVPIEHAEIGIVPFENARARLCATPAQPGPCPTLGEHNATILAETLGLSDEEITELVIAGAIE